MVIQTEMKIAEGEVKEVNLGLIPSFSKLLVPLALNCMTKAPDAVTTDDLTVSMASTMCLTLVAKVCRPSFFTHVMRLTAAVFSCLATTVPPPSLISVGLPSLPLLGSFAMLL